MFLEYTIAKECENYEAYYICLQCGKCGRKFDNGIMFDDGGTSFDEGDEDF